MDTYPSSKLQDAVEIIHYISPPTIFLYFIMTTLTSIFTLQTLNPAIKAVQLRRSILLCLTFFVAGSYIFQALTIGIYDLVHKTWSGIQDHNIYVLASALVWSLPVTVLVESQFPVWYPYAGCWILGMGSELFLVIFSNVLDPPKIWIEFVSIVLQILRVCALGLLICLYVILSLQKKRNARDPEREPLLKKNSSQRNGITSSGPETATNTSHVNHSGTGADDDVDDAQNEFTSNNPVTENIPSNEDGEEKEERELREKLAKRLAQEGNWFTYLKGYSQFFSLIWPFHDKMLQARALGVGLCLLLKNFLNILLPVQFGIASSSLLKDGVSAQGPWLSVSIYVALYFLSTTFISTVQDRLWLPIYLYGTDKLETVAYAHVMSLSADFHDGKSSSNVMQLLRDGQAVTELVETLFFEILPMFVDICVAVFYLYFLFGPYMVVVNCTMILIYLYYTIYSLRKRTALRKQWLKNYRDGYRIKYEGIRGWQTAAYFNQIPYENQRCNNAVLNENKSLFQYSVKIYATSLIQNIILSLGWVLAMYIAVYRVVVIESNTIANFITLVSYWQRLSSPLEFFGRLYKTVSEKLLHSEGMRELFETKPTIVDSPDAKPLECCSGYVEFTDVSFAYDARKPVIKGISFSVPGGTTLAIVGATGGGKSTILRLLSRFRDVNEGSIKIDGQDIRHVTLDSLRDKFGFVPQDPVLFNDTIMNNIRYARLDAADEEVHNACKGASIHEKITGFPDGYESTVGDNGVKLSGGERQRIAIARAILKNPQIILLDEATSAVDTETEAHIQETFATLCKGRTTFIVAHRLSTVMRADRIIVITEGAIVEEGSHTELVEKRGKYYDLWSKQTFFGSPEEFKQATEQAQNSEQSDGQVQGSKKSPGHVESHEKVTDPTQTSEQSFDSSKSSKQPAEQLQSSKKPKVAVGDTVKPESSTSKLGEALKTTKTGLSESNENVRLKPDAPEFIPRSVGTGLDGVGNLHESQEYEKGLGTCKQREVQSSFARKGSNKAESIGEASHSVTSRPSRNENKADEDRISNGNGKSKKTRSARRQQSKSEPAVQAAQESIRRTMDGAQETEWTGKGSGEGSLPLSPSRSDRRVSAPSDPPSGTLRDLRGASRGGRPRRPRHWRLRKSSQRSSLSTSGSGSIDHSASVGYIAPVTTPAEVRTPKIRFAPGF